MKHCHSPPWSLQLSPFHSQGASRAVRQKGRRAQELQVISGFTSFGDIRVIWQKHQTTRQDMLWDDHPGHTWVTRQGRSYSRHMLLCIALEKTIMQALGKLPQIPICF